MVIIALLSSHFILFERIGYNDISKIVIKSTIFVLYLNSFKDIRLPH